MKYCTRCRQDLPLDTFTPRNAHCRPCKAAYQRWRTALGKERLRALLAQGCSVCGTAERLVVDHCHATERLRGTLCSHCNLALGHAFDDPSRLRALAAYLEQGPL